MNPLLLAFGKGVVVGFIVAVPVGPMGVLCIRRSLVQSRWLGFVTGLGVATADAFYAAVAGFGLTLISGFLTAQQHLLEFLGAIMLGWFGVKIFLSQPSSESEPLTLTAALSTYASSTVMTLTNPATILTFVVLFAGFGFGAEATNLRATLLVAGVFAGSATWWVILSQAVGLSRKRFSEGAIRWVNRGAGALTIAFGVFALVSAIRGTLYPDQKQPHAVEAQPVQPVE